MTKTKVLLLVLLSIFLAGGLGWYLGFTKNFGEKKVEESATVMMEKIQKVFKFVAAEGTISDIYDYKDYQYYDISPFRKKVLIRVNAKVLVGYDFEKLGVTMDDESKTITIDSIGAAEILAIEHDLDYYDIQQGTFNYFSEEELTEVTAKAKNYALAIVEESDLFKEAEAQKDDLLQMLKLTVASTGWEIVIKESALKN